MYQDEIINKLTIRQAFLTEVIQHAQKNIPTMPTGVLRIHKNSKSISYYKVGERQRDNGILIDSNDRILIQGLANKSYLNKVLRAAQEEKKLIDQFLKRFPDPAVEDVYMKLPEARRQLISPVTLPDEEYKNKWLAKPYQKKGFGDDEPYYITQKGLRVRSKSEMLIAERLDAKGIPYKYECPLELKSRTVNPDFTILRMSDRKVIYYEHLGKMDDPGYAQKNVNKMREYALSGYTIGDKLYLTMETSITPLDMRVVDKMIEEQFS